MTAQPELSILVPSVKARRSLLSRLLWTLQPQLCDEVEVLVHTSSTIGMGAKFNELFERASGRLGVIVDDDDLVSPHYVARVLDAAAGADYVGYKVLYTINGCYREVYASDPANAVHKPYRLDQTVRHVMHHCPVEVQQARAWRFGDSYDADYYWVSQLIQNGYPFKPAILDEVLYHYDHWPQFTIGTHPMNNPRQRSVGQWPYDPGCFEWMGA